MSFGVPLFCVEENEEHNEIYEKKRRGKEVAISCWFLETFAV